MLSRFRGHVAAMASRSCSVCIYRVIPRLNRSHCSTLLASHRAEAECAEQEVVVAHGRGRSMPLATSTHRMTRLAHETERLSCSVINVSAHADRQLRD